MLRPLIRKSSLYLVLSSLTFAPLALSATNLEKDEEKLTRKKVEFRDDDSEYTIYSLVGSGIGMMAYAAFLFGYNAYIRATEKDTTSENLPPDDDESKSNDDSKGSYTIARPRPMSAFMIGEYGSSSGEFFGFSSRMDSDEMLKPRSANSLADQILLEKEQKIELTEEEKIELTEKELDALVSKVNAKRRKGSVQEWEDARENLKKKMNEIKNTILSTRSHNLVILKDKLKTAESCLKTSKS